MKIFLVIAVWLLAFAVGCNVKPGSSFAGLQISEDSITRARIAGREQEGYWKDLGNDDIQDILHEMQGACPAKKAVVFPRYAVEIFTEDSELSPSVEMFFDSSGEGYFRTSPGRETMFHSRSAIRVLDRIASNYDPQR